MPEEGDSAPKKDIRPLPSDDIRKSKNSIIAMEERNFLIDLARKPLSVLTERYARLGLRVQRGTI